MSNVPGNIMGIGQFIGSAAMGTSSSNSNSAGTARASANDRGSWYEAMSRAWGQTLDSQAATITQMSNEISAGGDQPSAMVQLTAASLKMQFMSNNAATSQNSVGQALETLGKRQ